MTGRIVIVFAALIASACMGGSHQSDTTQTGTALQRSPHSDAAQGDSAQRFVQAFYDWYLSVEAKRGDTYDSLLTVRRALLGRELYAALKDDIEFQHADTVAEIVSLSAEFDVFLNSQDPCEHYSAQAAQRTAAGYAVRVTGNCGGLEAHPNIAVELRSAGAAWEITNIKDPTKPTYDLQGALVRYKSDRDTPAPSSVVADSTHVAPPK